MMNQVTFTDTKERIWSFRFLLLGLTAVLMVVDIYLIFMWAPTATEEHQFNLQRVFYFHIPLAWVSFLAFFIVLVGSIFYLWKRSTRLDAVAYAAAEIGVVFTTLVLITGSIWARGIWELWWTWEPRLTTTLILWFIYLAYLMIRGYAPTPVLKARYSAVIGIVGFIDVPIVYFAASWWRGLHPEPVVGPTSTAGSLDPSMYIVLMFSMVTLTVLFAFLLRERVSMRIAEANIRDARYYVGI